MAEELKEKPSWIPVKLSHRTWTLQESASFEQFVKENSADIRRIFIKYSITK